MVHHKHQALLVKCPISSNEPNPDTSNEYQQEPVDLSIHNRIQQQPMDQPNPNTPGPNQRPTVIVAGPNILKQGRKRIIAGPSTPKRGQTQPIDQSSPSTSSQNQQQPMEQGESANTVPDQVAKRLVESKELRNKKREEYCKSMALKFEQWSALERGEEISGSKYNPDTENQLKQEYEKASRRVYSIRHDLKVFMEKHGLKFEEPDSD
ncbi:hypothetical protein BDEG_25944 [Batrachochytrium dendrobatidis JEL423]|uniref:Uncharacterized protein n=1 Tax=Batrachochytrium dendrobatidis (strain JEL423) TaxID=403673 RepID=A0A177WRG8_BATDL|nr:hypothetical protein BDEG_25944 [Batrachochytrium dendrobatidis JEL423]